MTILGMEASSQVASVAVLKDGILTAEYTINHKTTHSQTLLPMIDEILKRTETDIAQVDAIAITKGPGSFTGLRIGSATAKGIAEALKCPIIEMSTLKAMAYNFYGYPKLVCVIMDAKRQQTYTGSYTFEKNELVTVLDDEAMGIDELIGKLNALNRETMFVGDGIPAFSEYIEQNAKFEYSFAPAGFNRQRAGSVAILGEKLFFEGKTVSATEHVPNYLRVSQAERERAEKCSQQ